MTLGEEFENLRSAWWQFLIAVLDSPLGRFVARIVDALARLLRKMGYGSMKWSPAVQEIYDEAVEAFGGDSDMLEYGPGHIVWADGNLDDGSIQYCLQLIDDFWFETRSRRNYRSLEELDMDRKALERLLTIPEADRI